MTHKLLALLFLCSLVGLAYVAGVASSFYNIGPTKGIKNALRAHSAEEERLPDDWANPKELGSLLKERKIEWNKDKAYNGYTLITVRYSPDVTLIDMEGNTQYRWHIPFDKFWDNPPHIEKPAGKNWIYVEKAIAFPNGDLIAIYTAAGDTPYGYGMVKVDKNSNLIWRYNQNTHHDFSIDPNTGNILALTHRMRKDARNEYPHVANNLLEDFVVLLSPEGDELKRISVFKAFYNSPYSLLLNDYDKNELEWDRLHTNSISIITKEQAKKVHNFKEGQYLLSLRNMDTIAVLDPKTEQISWAYNGLWRAQHSPQILENGNILLLDNKGHVEHKRIFSRAIEFNPNTLAVEWSFIGKGKERFFSEGFGRIQRLNNGNTLITDAMNGHIFEVTKDKEIVWQFKIPQVIRKLRASSPRAHIPRKHIFPYTEEPLTFNPKQSGIIVSAIRYDKDALSFMNAETN